MYLTIHIIVKFYRKDAISVLKFVEVRNEDAFREYAFNAGCVYICTVSNRIYYDSVALNKRVLIETLVTLKDENERINLADPAEYVIYFVLSTKKFYIYSNKKWNTITDTSLSVSGQFADSKAVGDAIAKVLENANQYTDSAIDTVKKDTEVFVFETVEDIETNAKKYTDESIKYMSDKTGEELDIIYDSIDSVNKNIDNIVGNPLSGLDTIERLSKKVHENAQKIANIQGGGSTGGDGEGTTNGNIYIGDEPPIDENCNTWIDTSGLYPYLKYKDDNGEWISVAGGSGSQGNTNVIHIGPEEPLTSEYIIWIDTSREVAFMKYKDSTTGEWVVISGSGTGGSGGSTNQAVLTVANKSGWLSKTISYGAKCIINISWSSIEEGISTGNGTCKIIIKGESRRVYEIAQGDVEIDISNYLLIGNNDVQISVSDMYGNERIIKYSVTTVAISISSYFIATNTYTGPISYTYTPVGELKKTVHFILDGSELETQTILVSNREQTYIIEEQDHGVHTFEVYFTGDIDGQSVESNHLYYELMCVESGNRDPIIAIPYNNLTAQQYSTIPFEYLVYSYSSTSDIELLENGIVVQNLTVGRTTQYWSYRAINAGEVTLSIRCGKVERSKTITITPTDINISAATNSLELYLSSSGRSNAEEHPEVWENNGISAELTNFNFASDGWVLDNDKNTVLRIAGDARVNIPFTIFGGDFRTTGKTIEFEFATRDVLNYDATIISCYSGNRGIIVTAQKATLRSEQSEIFTQYKENEIVRVAFSIEKRSENRLLYIYINGIMSGAIQYPENDNFSQMVPVGITIGSSECTTDIYSIRIYNTNLTRYQLLDNWIADTQNIDLLLERYERNNIFDAYGNISIDKLPIGLPYMIIYVPKYSDLPQSKGDKKTVSGEYVDPLYPERSFSFEGAQIDVQGTSSQGYSRKNYKLKLKKGLKMTSTGETSENYALRPTSIPTNEFCFKADVASSEGANNVELVRLYDDCSPVKTPPQLEDSRIRQGIEGYPMVMFYGEKNSTMNFLGKYNFNNDKGTPEVYGLGDDDESWEILQNNTELVIWKDDNFEEVIVDEESGEETPAWKISFEARHPEDSTNITNLQELSSWIVSTDTDVPDLSEEEKTQRLEKFKNEFGNHFNKDLMLYNYIFTEMFLMVDNRAKNAFPTRYGEDGKWLMLPYDFDTAIGINNAGELKFGYELEDIDMVNGSYVFNGQESVLYVNMRKCFFDEITAMYQEIRSTVGTAFSYEEVAKRFRDHQSIWGEAIFNEDGRFKYIDPLIDEGNNTYLPMIQGSKEEQRKWWLYNRFRYLDSKYGASGATSDYIFLRSYGKADITVTPYADIYASAKFDSIIVSTRALRANGSCILKNPLTAANEGVIFIYSASQLSDVGDLSGLKLGMADFSMATKLKSLKVGSDAEGYVNENMNNLTIGNLTLLRTLDIRNCISLTDAVDLSGCTNIEYVYAEGTSITGISLPNGGILKSLHLPDTIVALTIINQKQLKDFQIASFDNLTTVRLEGVDWTVFDADTIITKLPDGARIRISGVEWDIDSYDEIMLMMDDLDRFNGMDESGNNLLKPAIAGVIHTGHITGEEKEAMYVRYPDLEIDWTSFVATVNFYVDDELVHTVPEVWDYAGVEDPVETGDIDTPTRDEDDTARYIYIGWSESLDSIQWNMNIYAEFYADRKYYVTFIDGNGEIIQVNGKDSNFYYTAEGENIISVPVAEELPYEQDGVTYIRRFDHWETEDGETITDFTITGGDDYDIHIYAKYTEHRVWVTTFMNGDSVHSIQYKCTGEYIEIPEDPTKESTHFLDFHFDGWSLNGSDIIEDIPTLVGSEDITYYAVYHSTDIYHTVKFINGDQVLYNEQMQYGEEIPVPEDPTKESDNYLNYAFKGWSLDGDSIVEPTTVGDEDMIFTALYNESTRYYTVRFFNNGQLIEGATVLVTYGEDAIYTGKTPTSPNDESFVGWEPSNLNVTEDRDCSAKFVYFLSHRFIRRSLIDVTSDVSRVATQAFYACTTLESVDLPNATIIGENAFYQCYALTSVNMPSLTDITIYSFANCTSLPSIQLPSANGISSLAFYNCKSLEKADFGNMDSEGITSIGASAFSKCGSLTTLILRGQEVCKLAGDIALEKTPIESGTGYIYVPANLYETYTTDSSYGWDTFKDQIRSIEEYPEICGV